MPPTFLIDSLNAVRRKVKVLSVAFGVGIVLASAVVLLLGTVALDFCFSYLFGVNLPSPMRAILLAAIVAAFVYAAVRYLVRPVLARLSLSEVAGHLESVFPQFDDRLRSTVDFVQQPAAIPGSEMMKDRVVTEATHLVQSTDLSQAVITKPVWYSLTTAVVAVALLVTLSASIRDLRTIGFARLLNPFGDARWPKRVEIDAAKLRNRVPAGQRLEVSMALTKGDKESQKAFIYYQYDNGPVQKEYMIRGKDGRYTASIDARGDNLNVWMAAGDDETAKQTIAVVPRLAIQGVHAAVTPPAYAQMQPATIDLARAPAFMVTGSQVALTVQFNKPLDPAKPLVFDVLTNIDAKNPKDVKPINPGITSDRADAAAPVGHWLAKDSFRFRIKATDTDGFENTALEEYEVIVKPDQLPTVMIESPKKTVDRTPGAYLPLQVLAEDDFGVASLRLLVDRIAVAAPADAKPGEAVAQAEVKKHWELPLKNWTRIDGTGERQRFRLNWDWELKETLGDVKPGDVLEYYVEVRDNYQVETTENGKTVLAYHPPQFSSKLRVNILSEQEIAVQVTDAIRSLAEKAKAVQRNQQSNKNETKNLAQDTKDKAELSKGDKAALEGLNSRESAIVSQTQSIAKQLEDVQKDLKENKVKDPELNSISKDAKQDLDNAAEKPMTEAANKLSQAAQSKSNPNNPAQQQQAKENRNEQLNQAEQKQDDASKKLNDAIDKMEKVGNLATAIKKMQDIHDEQAKLKDELKQIGKETLGKDKDALTPDQKKKLDENATKQKELADKMDKATEQMQKMGEQMAKSDPQSAQAMKEAAQKAQDQKISPQQRQASDNAQKNQQAQAQNQQQQAQLGIEVVLNTLKDAERRKLEQLAKQLDDTIQAIQDLVRRQAGHNIDNLDLQGADVKAKAMTKEEFDVLYAKAKRENKPGKVELAVITSGQETTERNTRNVAKDAEEKIKGDGAAIGQDLVRAAGKMGYAIVDLRDKKLATAYKPHQIDALNALEQALKKTEDAKKDAEKKKQEQQAEAVKALLEKIRGEQSADVNKPTADVDATRKADKTLPREQSIRVNQLVGKQGELSKRMTEVAETLRGLGGVIYDAAAREVASGMDEVKEDLNKQKTGKATQLEETRVIEQLDAMIASLKEEKDKSPFNQKGGGGGGGGGGSGKSKFPTEAELRLLKALQLAVNKNTVETGTLPKDQQDKVALVNLGNRQGKLRGLLDNLLKGVSGGEGLRPEPEDKNQLPEEASKEAIENQEAEQELLGGDPKADKESKQLNRVGDRMARSRQRLAQHTDAGKTTQEIQKRIVVDIDDMIKQAQQQQANNPPKPGEGQPKPKPGEGQQPGQQEAKGQGQESKPNNSTEAAPKSTVSGGGSRNADTSQLIKESGSEWGKISPRVREAVIEGATEHIPAKYEKLTKDYYRGVATGGKAP